jgi:hypothetical protein
MTLLDNFDHFWPQWTSHLLCVPGRWSVVDPTGWCSHRCT